MLCPFNVAVIITVPLAAPVTVIAVPAVVAELTVATEVLLLDQEICFPALTTSFGEIVGVIVTVPFLAIFADVGAIVKSVTTTFVVVLALL